VDVLVTDFSDDYKLLYRTMATPALLKRPDAGIAQIPCRLSVGSRLFDYDNDGWKDAMMVNGHVYPRLTIMIGHDIRQLLLFHNNHKGKFDYVPQ